MWQIVNLILIACAMLLASGCTSLPVRLPSQEAEAPTCKNIDWFEVGRTDGSVGAKLAKSREYSDRCQLSPSPFDGELYANGRNAGLVEYCTATIGFESGRNGSTYEGVCPDHLERAFLENYEVGQRVRQLESENSDLQSRIDDLVRLLAPNQPGSSVRAQIDQLRARRVQNETEIDSLENQASTADL